MQVCVEKDATTEEILEVCNRENPSGTSNGWGKVIWFSEEYPNMNAAPCADYPDRLHILVEC